MWIFKKAKKTYRKRKQLAAVKKFYTKEEKIKLIQEYQKTDDMPISMFSKFYGVSGGSLKEWLERYKNEGEAGLENKYGRTKEEIPEAIKEEIIRLKEENPGLGIKKISDILFRNKFVKVATSKVLETLKGNPKTAELIAKKPLMKGNSEKEPISFERSRARQMYQMDIMTFMLKRLYRVYVIACLDDFSRFVVSIGLFRRQTGENAINVLKCAIERYEMPEEMLTDNGRQFYTWRGAGEFHEYLIRSGIAHIRSRPYHPQTLGKIESLWRNMYQELLSKVPLSSFEEAEKKINEWVEWYNFKRPHQGIGGMVPADRFFGVDKTMREVMEKGAGMVKDSLIVDPRRLKEPMYLIGRIGGKEIKVIAKEGSIVVEGLENVEKKELQKEEKDVKSEVTKDVEGKNNSLETNVGGNLNAGDETNGNPPEGTDTEPKPEEIQQGTENGSSTGSIDQEEKRDGNMPGAENQPGDIDGMEASGV